MGAALSAGAMLGMSGCGEDDAATTEEEAAGGDASTTGSSDITNVSYDPTRELYEAYNEIFIPHWKEQSGQDVSVTQSHGGSGSQALAVAQGLEADVVTLALEADVNSIVDAGVIKEGWIDKFPNSSSPYTSTIVFLVRKGNPKNIQDWGDLANEGVGVVTPNPKTSGGARWNYLAALAWAQEQYDNDETQCLQFMHDMFANVVALDSGARGSTTTFVENGQGDVLVAWENEAFQSCDEYPDDYEIVIPSVSIKCLPSAAVVDEVVDKRGTRSVAEEYINYLYSDEGQELGGQYYYRPSNEEILQKFSDTFDLSIKLVTIDDFGGWKEAQEYYFDDGGQFDQIYEGDLDEG